MFDFLISNANWVRRGIGAAVAVALVAGAYIGVDKYAVDTAGDHVSAAEAQQLKAEGVDLFIQALTWWPRCSQPASVPWTRVESLRNAKDAGIGIAGYFLVDPHTSGRYAVDRAHEGVPDDIWDALEFVALDFEVQAECYPGPPDTHSVGPTDGPGVRPWITVHT